MAETPPDPRPDQPAHVPGGRQMPEAWPASVAGKLSGGAGASFIWHGPEAEDIGIVPLDDANPEAVPAALDLSPHDRGSMPAIAAGPAASLSSPAEARAYQRQREIPSPARVLLSCHREPARKERDGASAAR
jgi:hypothetical protein